MAMTSAEKQRAYRARLKEAERTASDETAEFVQRSFAAYIADPHRSADLAFLADTFDSIGLEFPDLSEDVDPDWRPEWDNFAVERGSLGKAERMVGALIDSADALARVINDFKLREIDAALLRVAEADLTNPEVKTKALADVVRLEGMKARLSKEVRRSFPVTTLKGGVATI